MLDITVMQKGRGKRERAEKQEIKRKHRSSCRGGVVREND